MSAVAKLCLWLLPFQLLAEQCDDEQVFMQRSPVKVLAAPGGFSANDGKLPTDITALPRSDAVAMVLPWASVAVYSILLMFLMNRARAEDMPAKVDVEAFREDVQVFGAAWERSSNLRKALLYFSYCRHIGSNIYGLTLALLVVLGNVGFALLFLEPWVSRPFWEESLHLLLGTIALLMATMVEATMRSRYALEANRAANVVLGFLGAKSRRCQELQDVTAMELVQWKEDLKEVLCGVFQLAVVPLQVAPVFLWLWMKLGYLTFLLLGATLPLALADRKSKAAVPAFLAYEEASRQRWDLLAKGSGNQSEVEFQEETQQLRRKALDALQVIHYQSQSLAFCISRWPQLLVLALLLCASRWLLLTPEVLLVVFLQCHYVLRHLSLLITVMTSSKWTSLQQLEAVLQQEEVPAVAEVNSTESHLLEMKGCFSWQRDDSPLPSLAKVDLKVTRGEVVAILGTAGAGKSSFLRAACGCLTPLNEAELRRTPSCMFLPAEPWIFQGTLQQNILCNRALDHERYQKVLKACGLDADLEDVHQLPRLWHQRIALARAFYGTEALLLMDDPFAGFSHEDVDQLSQIFHSDLFIERSCILSFGTSASQRMLRSKTLPGLRLILLEAGTMQVVQELPEFLNNEAFCCQRSSTFLRTTPKDVSSADIRDETPTSMVEFVSRIAKCNAFTWLSVLFLDQFLQIALDWWVLSTVLTSMPASLIPTLMLLGAHVSFKLLLAHFTSWMDPLMPWGPRPHERSKEREMDLFWPGRIWGLVAGLCSIFAWLALSYFQLTARLGRSDLATFSLVLVYAIAIKALPSMSADASPMPCEASAPVLQRSLELGMATTLLTGEERYFQTREEEILASGQHDHRSRCFLLPLGLCLSAAYTITALLLSVNIIPSKEAILTLAPFGVLLQFLIPWTGSLKECQVLGQHWRASRSKGNASEHLLKSERIQ